MSKFKHLSLFLFRSFSVIVLLFTFFFTLASAETAYAIVSLDSAFDSDGKVITSFGHDASANRMALQSDGKGVVVGYASNGSNLDWAIARYDTDGSLDTTFGSGGKVIKDFGIGDDSLNTVAIQADGKIVVGGHSRGTSTTCSNNPNFTHTVCWTVARYNTDGSLDTSFGNGGIVFSSVRDGTDSEFVNRIAIQADGKIVAVGSAYDLGVVRYNTNGSEDFKDLIVIPNSFSDPATFFPSIPAGELAANGTTVRIQQDGKILIAGNAGNHMFLLRLNSNNSFDTTFGIGGLRRTGIAAQDETTDMALQPDGMILVTGSVNSNNDTFVAKFTQNGDLDNAFGSGGVSITNFAEHDRASSLLLESNGKVIVGGQQETNGNYDYVLRKFNTDGTLDSSFGTNGSFITAIGQNNEGIADIALQNDGKLIAVGASSNGSHNDWALARFSGVLTNQQPVVNAISNATINEGASYSTNSSFTDTDSASWSATVDYGDGSGVQPLTLNPDKTFSLSHLYKDNGTYTVTVSVTDNQGAVGTVTATVTVNNIAPAVETITVTPSPAHINEPITTSANFTDAGVLDTHTASWNWGDSTTTTGSVSEASGSGSVSNSHTYTNFGTYTITLTIEDKDNATGTKTTTITIVKQITVLNPAEVWLSKGLLNVGMRLDVLAEAYKDTTLVSSGQLNSVQVGSGGFNNADLVSIPFNSFSPVDFPSGSELKIKVSARNACSGSLLNFGTARLWFNDSQANSHFGATVGTTNNSYYLLDNFLLSTTVGVGPRQNIDVAAGAKCSPFKPFGTWVITP